MPAPPVTYLTKAEAAEIARVSPRTIENWIRRGWLRSAGTSGLVLIKPEWLEEMLEQKRGDDR